MTGIWGALARLVAYPDERTAADVRAMLPSLRGTAGAAGIGEFLDATAAMALAELQEQYTAAFDFDPACALDLGWHLFGESRERGAFLSALREDLRRADIAESSELPDHLAHVLALVSRDEYERAAQLADLVMPAVADIDRALTRRGSPYAHVVAAAYAEMARRVERGAGASEADAGSSDADAAPSDRDAGSSDSDAGSSDSDAGSSDSDAGSEDPAPQAHSGRPQHPHSSRPRSSDRGSPE